ncbi:MAG: hypothetical protein AMJ79_06725 [Phycisphaerae bacterium SM23_30]|nr:MAG: hypothetical protein AMJ79_06725 [Phycisphaerae bacterium SM23_30]
MVRFSTDVDLLKWELVLFRELFLPSQTLCFGQDGVTSGTIFTSSSASFTDAGVAAGHVIYLNDGDSIDSCYEVVSKDTAMQLTLSIVRQRIDDAAVAPPEGSSISYRISTFDPQTEEVAYSLLQYFGIKTTDEDADITATDILNVRALRQASVFAVLSAVFASSACGQGDPAGYWQKSLGYQKMFHTARARARLEIDIDNDSIAEQLRTGGTVRLRRL